MKKFWQISVLIILLTCFGIFELYKNSGRKVIKVFTPSRFAVDINRNNTIDEGEIICIPDLTTFTSDIRADQTNLSNALHLTAEDALRAGYMADTFAKRTLENKNIKLKFEKQHSPDCKFAHVFVDGKDYKEEIEKQGFAIFDKKALNQELFNKQLQNAKKLNLVLVNPSSGKFHTLNCKFGLNSADYKILPMSEAEKDFDKCRYCFKTHTKTQKPKEEKHTSKPIIPELPISSNYPESFQKGNITFLVSDYTKKMTPDRTCEHVFCKEMAKLINSTQDTLDITVYGWADIPEISKSLKNAQNRGVKIRIVYDKRFGREYYPETQNFINSIKNTRSDEIAGDSKLTSMLMHNKFIISDNKTVFTGSMNFSTTGLSGFNANNVVIVNSPMLAKLYTKEFEQMYSGKFHTLKTSNPDNRTSGDIKISAYFSPQDKTIQKQIIPLINNAESYIYIPAFVITHYELSNALIAAKNRNVNVKIITDATSSGMTHNKISELRKAGISLKTETFTGKMHAKSIIIDDKFVITGSMNFSNSGENKNDENCLIIEDAEIAKFYRGYFEYIWTKIPDKWLYRNVRAESKDSIGSCSDGLDNDYDGKIDSEDNGCL